MNMPEPFSVIVDDAFNCSAAEGRAIIKTPNKIRQTAPVRHKQTPSLLSALVRGGPAGSCSELPAGAACSPVSSSSVMWKHSLKALSLSSSGVDRPVSLN